jgi:uncharacterized protein (TIGR01244 family)
MFRRLDENMLVAGQLRPKDMETIKTAGVTMIVNNRPDGEEPGQPSSAEIEAAARLAGLDYRSIPVGPGGLGRAQVEAMAAAIDDAEGAILAYCLSGTRSTFLWALARADRGEDGDILIAKAAGAGYDIGPIANVLKAR